MAVYATGGSLPEPQPWICAWCSRVNDADAKICRHDKHHRSTRPPAPDGPPLKEHTGLYRRVAIKHDG